MCQTCFNEDWGMTDDDGQPVPSKVAEFAAWVTSQPDDRRALITACYELTVKHQAAPDWMGGLLHAAIDDDNYDIGTGGQTRRDQWRTDWQARYDQPWNEPPGPTAEQEDRVCEAWDALTEEERSLVVSWRNAYWPFHPDPIAKAALPHERDGHLPTPPWDTPINPATDWDNT